MTCQDVIEILSDYLEEALGPAAIEQLEHHLRDCGPCVAYLNTFRKSRELAVDASQVAMPPEMRQRLRNFLFEHLS